MEHNIKTAYLMGRINEVQAVVLLVKKCGFDTESAIEFLK